MRRTYKLEHFAKGTGATVVPSEDEAAPAAPEKLNTVRVPARPRKQRLSGETTTTPLPPGHVRKKATGELGKVRSVDPGAGTAVVFWLKQGRTSTVPLSSISRR